MDVSAKIQSLKDSISDNLQPIAKRMRAVFLLKQAGCSQAIDALNTG